MQPRIWLETGVIITYGASIDAAPHSHHAIQIVWPTGECIAVVNEEQTTTPIIINSQIEHQLNLTQGWILLVEPQSDLGVVLQLQLNGQAYLPFVMEQTPALANKDFSDLFLLLQPLFNQLNLTKHWPMSLAAKGMDKRIERLLRQLNDCLQGPCIKPEQWRATDVAAQLALSESRFLHVFRQNMGIAWRPYLLWRRIICAIKALLSGASATEAAYVAGFSDGAHLSRTFRKNFGLSIRQASAIFSAAHSSG